MLEELYISNIVLIDKVKIDFSTGFNILTGESGSGKSLIAGALSVLKGNKADSNLIRSGYDSAEISAVFSLEENKEAKEWLAAKNISYEDNSIIIRRTFKTNGRNAIAVQSVPIARNELIELTSFLFDIHGQHEQHTLMSEDRQRSLLDSYSGISKQVADFSSLFSQLAAQKRKLAEFELSEKERLRDIDILKFTIDEIQEAKLAPSEDEKLEDEFKLLSSHEKLFRMINEAHEMLSAGKDSVLLALKNALLSLSAASQIDDTLNELNERAANSFYDLEDVSDSLRTYILKDNFSPQKLEIIEDRLSAINKLKKKYGPSLENVFKRLQDSVERLSILENMDTDREKLKADIKAKEEKLFKDAQLLSESRARNAQTLEKNIADVLKTLGMPNIKFKISVNIKKNDAGKPVCSSTGFNQVEFLLSPNVGEALRPVNQVASGGELSRIMLAIKSVFADSDTVTSMLFDEIDSGIGGEVAVSLGYHMQKLSKSKQIICITHLASIAVNADNHIRVKKIVENQRTFTTAEKVDGSARVEEVARMLSGDKSSAISLDHARAMLEKKGK